ncbi:hypothetical protein PR003_g10489 [Phytophthora rubi]|uniref:Uncharacterized protein n=1 Tax=Phytophthora rubi TaxID=129364 RepID=A0A6A3KWS4_9STRA|nr:hypothetical protein PR002_g15988 [Phytophthora rubi]KAE9340444.1 hypothetical protein PR003_g10489 [Phytophthora rubi]
MPSHPKKKNKRKLCSLALAAGTDCGSDCCCRGCAPHHNLPLAKGRGGVEKRQTQQVSCTSKTQLQDVHKKSRLRRKVLIYFFNFQTLKNCLIVLLSLLFRLL